MYFNSADIEEDLKCSFCQKKLVDIVKLVPDCGESICGACNEELKNNVNKCGQFKCHACSQLHSMPQNGLPDCKSLNRLLKKRKIEKPLSEQAERLKRRVDLLPSEMRALEKFDEREHANLHCDLLEVEVVEEVESLMKELNELGNELVAEIRQYRQKCLDSLSASSSSTEELKALAKDLNEFGAKWSDYFGRFDSFATDSDIEAALNTTKNFETRMQSLGAKLKSNVFDGRVLVFRAFHSLLGERGLLRRMLSLTTETTDSRIQQTQLATLSGHTERVNQVIFTTNAELASCSSDQTIKIWSVKTCSQLFELRGHSGCVQCLAVLQNGWLASGSRDRTVVVWDLEERRPLRTLLGHTDTVASLGVLRNGNLASYSLDDTVRIWNPYSGDNNLLRTIVGHGNSAWIIGLGVLADDRLVTVSRDTQDQEDCVLRVWSSQDGALVSAVSTGCRAVGPMRVLSNDRVAFGTKSGALKVVDLADHARTRLKEEAYNGSVLSIEEQMSSNGGNLITCGFDAGVAIIKLWALGSLELLQAVSTGHTGPIDTLSLSPDQELLASASFCQTIRLWPVK